MCLYPPAFQPSAGFFSWIDMTRGDELAMKHVPSDFTTAGADISSVVQSLANSVGTEKTLGRTDGDTTKPNINDKC